ncbi:hypothetical protein [Halorussus salinisoli]|uniref:hypothetical protein n=1 Tax=Halorussus salinisoli TaxID=2558242 RepID=UPI0010C1EC9D|nr:hypothetical protein [Halorussus salinisoli]
MPTITIYDSEGKQYSPDQATAERNERIEEFFFAGVRLSLNLSHGAEIIAFFRARESKTGRAEQYYAQYQIQTFDRSALAQFKTAIEERASELGLELDTSGQDVQVFRELGTDPGSPPGDDFDRKLIEQLLQQRRRVKVGVGSYTKALALLSSLNLSNARQIAIADDGQKDVLSDYNLVIEQGPHQGIQPIGKTKSDFEDTQSQREDQYIKEKIQHIKSEAVDIQKNTSISEDELQRRLEQKIPVLSTSRSSSHTSSRSSTSSTSSRHRGNKRNDSLLNSKSLPRRVFERIGGGKTLVLFISILLIICGLTGVLYFSGIIETIPGGSIIPGVGTPAGNDTTTTPTTTTTSLLLYAALRPYKERN